MSRGSRIITRKYLAATTAVSALLIAWVVPLTLQSSVAAAATSVTPGAVELGSPTAGAVTNYTVGFRTSGSGSLGVGSIITLLAPAGTTFPTACSLLNCPDYSVTATSGSATVSGVTVSGSSVKINLAVASISASDPVTVTISGVTNPTVASASDAIEESTSADANPVPTSVYKIAPGPVASVNVVSGAGQTAETGTSFPSPLVVVLLDRFKNTEPANTPVTFTAPTCTSPCATGTFADRSSTESVMTDAGGEASSGSITANANAGSYSVTATANQLSTSFGLRNVFPVTPGAVQVTSSQAGVTTTYTLPFATSSVGSCPAPGCTINFTGPSGTVFPSTISSYGISVSNNHSATVGTVSAPVGGDNVSIGLSASTIAAGDTVTVTVTGVRNPTHATANDTIQEWTSTDAAPAATQPYSITAADPASISPYLGDSQSAVAFSQFPSPLIAVVTDAYGNPVPGVQVTFNAPVTMNGAVFASCDYANPSLGQCISVTDGSGFAVAPGLIAGATAGVYGITATTGALHPAIFNLIVLQSGYWLAGGDGGIFSFGGAPYAGSEGGKQLNAPIVGAAAAPNGGYYEVASDGGVFSFGGAPFHGSRGGHPLNAPIVGMAVDPSTGGYWLVASDGGVFSYNAPFFGSTGGRHLNKPVVGMAAAPGGTGYYLVASDGGIFSFNAPFYQSMGGHSLNAPVVGMAVVPSGGYYLVASDGGIFNFGPGTVFLGSASGLAPYGSVVGMAIDPATGGYWIADRQGDVYSYGTQFYGGMQGKALNKPIVAIASSAGL